MVGLTAGLVIAIPTLSWRNANHNSGVLLVNGRIEGTEVAIGTRLPGRISRVNVQEGQEIKAGTLLVELDAGDVQAAYDQAQASVRQARHNLDNASEQAFCAREQMEKTRIGMQLVKQQTELNINQAGSVIQEAQAGIDQAKALLNKTKTEYDQAIKLQKKKAASDLEFTFAKDALIAQEAVVRMTELKQQQARDGLKLAETRRSEIKMQEHDLAVMESTVRQAQAALGVAKARLQAAEAFAKTCEIQLKDTKIIAPCNGTVVTRVIEPGEIVSIGATVLIVVDSDKLSLKGYLPNDQIGKIKLNAPARIFLDAYPDKYFDAQVTKINQQAEYSPRTVDTPKQRANLFFGIELKVNNSLRIFKPGMSADAVVKYDPAAPWRRPEDLR